MGEYPGSSGGIICTATGYFPILPCIQQGTGLQMILHIHIPDNLKEKTSATYWSGIVDLSAKADFDYSLIRITGSGLEEQVYSTTLIRTLHHIIPWKAVQPLIPASQHKTERHREWSVS